MLKIPEKKQLNQLNVLIIDEQSFAHDVIKSSLKDLGIENVKSAQNAFYALRLCQTTSFDMVLIAFDVKSDKDGFNLLEEMKFKGYINSTTIVIFLSSDTSAALVHCVVELQPNDFWVKPLDKLKVEKRIRHVIEFEQKLYKLHYCFDQAKYATAIYMAQRHVVDEELKAYRPQINRLIGKSLYLLHEYTEAEVFYRHLSEQYNFAWVLIGLARTLFSQAKITEAMQLTNTLLERDDARFNAFDLLAEYYIDQEDYPKAYDIIQQACKLAPRSIERNKKCWNLARLNHDRKGQYIATKNMAKYAKNSIHDSPELELNIIRASLDLASTLSEQEARALAAKTEKDLLTLESDKVKSLSLHTPLLIARARLCNLRKDKKSAENLLKDQMSSKVSASFEDSLDRMKVYHELGHWQLSLELLEKIQDDGLAHSFTGKVLAEYLVQESKERKQIRYSAKELVEMASAHYKGKRYKPTYNLLAQALQISPKNSHIMLSILKVLVILAQQDGLDEEQQEIAESCSLALSETKLSEQQQSQVEQYVKQLDAVMAKHDG